MYEGMNAMIIKFILFCQTIYYMIANNDVNYIHFLNIDVESDYVKKCPLFDDLWNKTTNKYLVPSKSFCSDFCGWSKTEPNTWLTTAWFECEKDIMPNIKFFFEGSKQCTVETRKVKDDPKVLKCIKKVADYLKTAQTHYDTKLIYVIHGWNFYIPGYKGEEWEEDLGMSFLTKYNDGSKKIVVGVLDWKWGARLWSSTDSRISKAQRKAEPNKLNWALQQLMCCSPIWVNSRYLQSAANTWPVGNIVAYVNHEIAANYGSHQIRTYCVGFSLGAHVCGFFGKMVKKLSPRGTVRKIIGLDPGGPLFDDENQDPNLRLNKGDALRVDIFHTNALSLGVIHPIGHVDFYINGGGSQPCSGGAAWNLLSWLSLGGVDLRPSPCSHEFAWQLLKALNNNKDAECYAEWKCDITDGYKLVDIKTRTQAEAQTCNLEEVEPPFLGTLDTAANSQQGVYWLQL